MFKFFLRQILLLAIAAIVVLMIAYLLWWKIQMEQLKPYYNEASQLDEVAIPDYIDKLIQCESSWVPDIKTLDTNGYYSYGLLQWQLSSFNFYGEKYNLPHNDIWSPVQQIAIAKKILEEKNGWQNWYICSKKIGLDKYAKWNI